jgi:sulfur carrier protein ThiS
MKKQGSIVGYHRRSYMPTVTIAGLAGTTTVDVPEGSSVADVLAEANQAASGLDAAVDGTPVNDVESADVNLTDGSVVSLTPQNVKLGA